MSADERHERMREIFLEACELLGNRLKSRGFQVDFIGWVQAQCENDGEARHVGIATNLLFK